MDLRTFKRLFYYFRLFYGMTGRAFFALIFLVVAGTAAELVSVSLFIPLLEPFSRGNQTTPEKFHFLYEGIAALGLEANFKTFLLLILGIFWIKAALVLLQKTLQGKILADLHLHLRAKTLAAIGSVSYPFFAGRKSGYFANLLTREVPTTAACFKVYALALSCLITFTVYLGGVFLLDPLLAGWSVVFGAMSFLGLRFLFTKAKQYSDWMTASNNDFNHYAIELVSTFKYLKGASLFAPLFKKLKREIKKMRSLLLRQQVIVGAMEAISEPLALSIAAAYVFYVIDIGGKSVSMVFPIIYLLYRAMRQLSAFQSTWQKFENDTGAIDFVVENLMTLEREKEVTGKTAFSGLNQEISLEGVSVFFHGREILKDVNLKIRKGEVTALVGESGCGKSTLSHLVLHLLSPHQGRILVDGKNLGDLDVETFRRHVGYVPQDYAIYHDSIGFNLTLGKEVPGQSQEAMNQVLQAVRADAFIGRVPGGIETVIGDRGSALSGGECQRLHLARELLRDPEILILDEATKNLDAYTENVVFDTIYRLRPRVTTLVVAHRLSLLDRADAIHVIANGQIVESGTYESLLRNPDSTFRAMWQREQAETQETEKMPQGVWPGQTS